MDFETFDYVDGYWKGMLEDNLSIYSIEAGLEAENVVCDNSVQTKTYTVLQNVSDEPNCSINDNNFTRMDEQETSTTNNFNYVLFQIALNENDKPEQHVCVSTNINYASIVCAKTLKQQSESKRYRSSIYTKDALGNYQLINKNLCQKLKPRCHNHTTVNSSSNVSLQCSMISDEMRLQMFDYFWSLDSNQAKQTYISNLVSMYTPNHRRKDINNSVRKKWSIKYYLGLHMNNKIHKFLVCKTMFFSTLRISERNVRRWISK